MKNASLSGGAIFMLTGVQRNYVSKLTGAGAASRGKSVP